MDLQTLEQYLSQQRSDDFFRSLGFSRGRQDAIDYAAKLRENDPANIMKKAIEKYEQQVDDYNRKYKEFDENNPFNFDQVLEEERANVSQRLDPYYEQTLNDYLQGINMTRSRSLEDERTLLTELNRDVDQFSGREKENLDYTLEQTREGFEDAGIYNSGKRLRAEGRATADSQDNLGDYLSRAEDRRGRIETNRARTFEDLSLSEQLQRRDLAREKSYNVETGALSEVQRRQGQREFERGQYTGAYPGTDPLAYQNTLYGFLTT